VSAGIGSSLGAFRLQDAILVARKLAEIAPKEDAPRYLVHLAELLVRVGNNAEARRAAEQAQQLASDAGDIAMQAAAVFELGHLSSRTGDQESAMAYFQDAGRLFGQVGDAKGIVKARSSVASALLNTGRNTETDALLREVEEEVATLGDAKLTAQWAGNYAELCNRLGRTEQAVELCRRAIATARGNHPFGEVVFTANLATYLYAKGEYHEASVCIEEAIRLAARYGIRTEEARLLCIRASHLRGSGDIDQGVAMHHQSLALAHESDNERIAMVNTIELGNIALSEKQFTKAEQLYQDALAQTRRIKDVENQVVVLSCLGAMHIQQQQYDAAQNYYEEGLRLAAKAGYKSLVAELRIAKGAILVHQKRYRESLDLLHQCRKEFAELQMPAKEALATCEIGKALLHNGDIDEGRIQWREGYERLQKYGSGTQVNMTLQGMKEACAEAGVPPFTDDPTNG
jgi:tetratricopeptide (TPR) repeat protein